MKEIFSMSIGRLLKRFYYKLKNSDPAISCPVYKNEGCAIFEDPMCNVKDCSILKEYMDEKWIGCTSCLFLNTCGSKNFGLGCSEGIKDPLSKI